MKTFFSLLIIIIFAKLSFASMCLEYPPPVVNFYRSEVIFIGKILSVKRYYGIPRNDENWNMKYKIVELEVQKSYKGIENGKKISVINPYGSKDWEDLKIKKGQQWAIYAQKVKDHLIIYNGCSPWSEQIESQKDFNEWDEYLTTRKNQIENDKQAIVGRVFDEGKWQEIENLDVVIQGNDQQITIKTDNEGRFYVPVKSTGEYIVKINFPQNAAPVYYNPKGIFDPKESKDTIRYKVNLQKGEFDYTELRVILYK